MRTGLRLTALTALSALMAVLVLAAAPPAARPGCTGHPSQPVWCRPSQ
jgi:hypothetical protein